MVFSERNIVFAEHCHNKAADLVFILDSSNQVGSKTWNKMLGFVQSIVNRLPMDRNQNRIGIATYGANATIQFNINQYSNQNDVIRAIENITYRPHISNLTAGLNVLYKMFTKENGDRQNKPNMAILVTASSPEVTRESVLPLAHKVRKRGTRLFTVGINGRVDRVELKAIATDPDIQHFFYTPEEDKLMTLVNKIVPELCSDILCKLFQLFNCQ